MMRDTVARGARRPDHARVLAAGGLSGEMMRVDREVAHRIVNGLACITFVD
jgi:hypothetical protein